MPRTRVSGGKKLAAFFRASRKAANKPKAVDVGFLDPHVGRLAARLEFGDENASLPERPAFRGGVETLKRTLGGVVRDAVSGADWKQGITIPSTAVEEVGVEARDTIKRSYETFVGPGLSESQEARKRGTPGAGKELIGSEGPRLVSRIKARIVGGKVL